MKAQPQYVPIYFAPDADPSWLANPGVLSMVSNLTPTVRGTYVNYCATAAENFVSVTPLVSALVPNTARILRRVGVTSGSGSARLIIGCYADLLEPVAGALTNVSKGVGAYAASEWAFDAFGGSMLGASISASQPTQPIQVSTGAAGTAFADLTNAPKAALIVVQRGFVVAYNCYDGTNWYNDGWMCSGLQNPTSWCATMSGSANLATQANYGRVYETSGGWRAAHRMRDGIAAYKADSIYLGSYTGPITASSPNTWSHRLVSDRVGVANHNAVAIVNGVHYFIHRTGVYRFDGSYPQAIGDGKVDRWLSERIVQSYLYEEPGFRAQVDEERSTITWWFLDSTSPSAGQGVISAGLVYNYQADKFGFIDRPWDEQGSSNTTYFCCPVNASRNEIRAWTSSFPVDARLAASLSVGIAAGSITLRGSQFGNSARSVDTTCALATGDIGDDITFVRTDQVKPRMLYGDDELIAGSCVVDVKDGQADVYRHAGTMFTATATGTGAGSVVGLFLPPDAPLGATYGRTLIAGDYLAFDAVLIEGALTTPFGVTLTFTDTTTALITTTFTARDKVVSVLSSLAPHVGKKLSLARIYYGTPGATGFHRAVLRNLRFTDSAGVNRFRLKDGNDLIAFNAGTVTGTSWTTGRVFDVKSYGTLFTCDARRRRFQGNVTGRVSRAQLTLANKCEIGGLFINSAPQGPE